MTESASTPAYLTLLCPVSELAECSSKGFKNLKVFAVKQHGEIYVYRNHCPHLGIPLEWEDHQFLDSSVSMIQCANHGALFVINTGQCVSGPCTGHRLQVVHHHIINDQIWIQQA